MISQLFLCIGAQKAGTTWLHSLLQHHPKIKFSRTKEIHYFSAIHLGSNLLATRLKDELVHIALNDPARIQNHYMHLVQGTETADPLMHSLMSQINDRWYQNLFDNHAAADSYCADFTPAYALLPASGFAHIKKVAAKVKILFVMRDPLARALSAIRYAFRESIAAGQTITHEQIRSMARMDFILNRSRYEYTVTLLDQQFSPHERIYLFFEQMMQAKQASVRQILDFCGLEPMDIAPRDADQRINASSQLQIPDDCTQELALAFRPTYDYIAQRFGGLPAGWRRY